MTRKEILEFLELPEAVSDEDIANRLQSKLVYFVRLNENAPNDFLRKLHLQNIEKVKLIQGQYGFTDTEPNQVKQEMSGRQKGPSKEPLAWLIRHTEGQPIKRFPLYNGGNPVGRGADLQKTGGLSIEDDDYVSRRHAVVYVESTLSGTRFFIEDSAESNGGRPSKNGTYINGTEQRISKRVLLTDQDTIQIGLTKLILRLPKADVGTLMNEVEESGYMKTVVINIF